MRQKNGCSHNSDSINRANKKKTISTTTKNRNILNEKQQNEFLPLCHNCLLLFVVRTYTIIASSFSAVSFVSNGSIWKHALLSISLSPSHSRRHFNKFDIQKRIKRENVAAMTGYDNGGASEWWKADWDSIKNASNMLWNDGKMGIKALVCPSNAICGQCKHQTINDV